MEVNGLRRIAALAAALALANVAAGPAALSAAQVRQIDPNAAIDRDLQPAATASTRAAAPQPQLQPQPGFEEPVAGDQSAPPPSAAPEGAPTSVEAATRQNTYQRRDVFNAAEDVFGKGAKGLAEILEKILRDQGEPNAYIAGREASGAFVVGLRYGSGVMSHKIEGDMPVYWTGPSVGFDAGGNASKVFVLVYNLYDSHDIFRRFPEGEGHLYLVGGFSATYLRRGNIVLIPVRLGVGLRAGVNIGYMKFSKKAKWLPL